MPHSYRRRLLTAAVVAIAFGVGVDSFARTIDFNLGWRFKRGDHPEAKQLAFDDYSWEEVNTPHDWAIAGPFDANEKSGYAGKLPWRGVAWYRKWIAVDRREEGSQVYLDFDGVMASPKVYVNGQLAGEWDYGYTPFRIDITPYVKFGRANVVAVRVDTTGHGTRWYPGAGIYRKAFLTVSPPVHLVKNGTAIVTSDVSAEKATVTIDNEIENHLESDEPIDLEVTIYAPDWQEVAKRRLSEVAKAGATIEVSTTLELPQPQLWDIDSPTLYQAKTSLLVAGKEVERRDVRFGVRTIELTPSDGLLLNGRRVALKGVNLHHDLGPLGGAFNRRAAERQLEIMQEMGANAIRTAHNPPAAELLDLCDERGVLVWDELFDKWNETADKRPDEPFEPYYARHAAALVRRDRNHPSVFVWSIGNEIVEAPHDPHGLTKERVAFAREAIRAHDATRPVGLGCHIPHSAESGVLDALDFTGWNYQARYERARNRYPDKPIIYSETASALSTRGAYRLPIAGAKCDFPDAPVVNAYEFSSAAWADIPEVEFERLRRDDYLLGEFIWTGFDYLGEPTPFEHDARSSYFGVVDLVGLPKDRYYLYRSLWRPHTPTVHIAPHWNWNGHEGQNVPVIVYTNGDSAELFLNGKSLGVRRKGERPSTPKDLAAGATLEVGGAKLTEAATSSSTSLVSASASESSTWSMVQIGAASHVRSIALDFPRESKLYGYRIEAANDDGDWREVASHVATHEPAWGGVNEAIHHVDVQASKLRVVFGACLDNVEPKVSSIRVYADKYESPYYLPTYDYRLRWNEVAYEPGELRAVAYQEGEPIGEAVVRTAGAPAKLVLTADRSTLTADGQDLAFVTLEAVDERGTPCPLADALVEVEVTGVGKLAAAAGGDPTSMRSFQDSKVALFNGKAVAIIRADQGLGGEVTVEATAAGLPSQSITLQTRRQSP
ncbi:Beta-galactosidase [Planctomycetes bacterium K2D]|nr:Beta-galactosidase [Planctomycetes bacterium K2D]